jgi:proteasome lid subunit RPN8/RPN11
MRPVVRIRREIVERMLEEAHNALPLECCGLLAGTGGVITRLLAATNALASSTQFEIAPAELFALFREMRRDGLEHLGIYHSHPTGKNEPSPLDVERANYPEAAHFIISPGADPALRAFLIRGQQVEELEIRIEH